MIRAAVWWALGPVGVDGPRWHRCAKPRSLQISDKGAVRGTNCPNWHGYVEAHFLLPQIVSADVEIGGVRLAKGDWTMFGISGGNNDLKVFPDPRRFDPFRDNRELLTFGRSSHFCLDNAGVVPYVGLGSPGFAELDIVAIQRSRNTENRHELMF